MKYPDFEDEIPSEAYIARDSAAESLFEYEGGTVYSMAGGTIEHGLICGNIITTLNNALADKPCIVLTSDVKVSIETANSYKHPDVTVVCGEPEHELSRKDTLTNPILIIEVLSDTTAQYDRQEKFARYRLIKGLREYVLVSQDRKLVETFYREGHSWYIGEYVKSGSVQLKSLGIEIELEKIYNKVTRFPREEFLRTLLKKTS